MNRPSALLPIVLMLAASAAVAEDTVFARSARGDETRLIGRILDYDGQTLRLQTVDGQQRSIPAEQVIRIETQYMPQHTQAKRAVAEGRPEAKG